MKNIQYLIVILTLTFMTNCTKSDEFVSNFLDCEGFDGVYKKYEGEKIECQFHFILTKLDNQHFIELISHCADLSRPVVFNEQCIDICENNPFTAFSDCNTYLLNREVLEVILIEE